MYILSKFGVPFIACLNLNLFGFLFDMKKKKPRGIPGQIIVERRRRWLCSCRLGYAEEFLR